MEDLFLDNGMIFEDGTIIGCDIEDIQKMSTEELISLKIDIYNYLNIKKQKKRNLKYIDLFSNIQKELKLRREKCLKDKICLQKRQEIIQEGKTDLKRTKTSFSAKSLFDYFKEQNYQYEEEELLNKKTKNSINIEIPNFFNDKKRQDNKITNENSPKDEKENTENLNSNFNINTLGKF